MSKPFPKLDISKIFSEDIQEIFSARKKSKILHETKDINASGDEIENTIRRVIRRKLPIKYYVSQGHITDESSITSNQLDLIIADNTGSPVLFTSENGTEYFPFESIYAFAEIKSTYYKAQNYIEDFVSNTERIYEQLKREKTSVDQITQDVLFKFPNGQSVSRDGNKTYYNPLFKFMCFVNSNNFKIQDFNEVSKRYDDKFMPNVICFLDKGVLVKAKIKNIDLNKENYKIDHIEPFPEFIKENEKHLYRWVFLTFDDNDKIASASLAFLIFMINEHLSNCLVLKPKTQNYFKSMFKYTGQFVY